MVLNTWEVGVAKQLTKEQRLEVLQLYKNKTKVYQIAEVYDVSRQTISSIIKKFKETGEV